MLDLSLSDWWIWYEKVWATIYLVPSDTWVLEIYLLKNLKSPHDKFLYDESFNSYHSHIYMLAKIGKPAHRLLTLHWIWLTHVRPLSRGWSCSQDQDHLHPHISAAPTLGVHKNMPFPPKNLSPTLEEDPERLLGFQINAPRLWFVQVHCILNKRKKILCKKWRKRNKTKEKREKKRRRRKKKSEKREVYDLYT
jgi:hypothetical protein